MTRSPLNFRLSGTRRAVEATLISQASVYRKTQTTDNAGGFTDTYAVVATYQCRFYAYPITPIEKESTTQVQSIVFWRFIFPYDADIEPTDRLTVGDRTFEVVRGLMGSMEITLDVLCQEIT